MEPSLSLELVLTLRLQGAFGSLELISGYWSRTWFRSISSGCQEMAKKGSVGVGLLSRANSRTHVGYRVYKSDKAKSGCHDWTEITKGYP